MADEGAMERISSQVVAMLKAPTWVSPIANFIDMNCIMFDDAEENKLEYTLIHKAFTQLVDELLAAHLVELSVTTDEFLAFCQHGLTGENQVHRQLVEQLASVDDFLIFKAMMVKRSADLRRETLASEEEADKARQEAEHLEVLRLEAERLDTERRCLEAELQLMVALSIQLEQRLQLTMALNELVEAVSKMEALAAEAAAEEAAAEAVPAPVPTPTPVPALPPTVRVQPLRSEEPPAPAPAPAPVPARAPAPAPAPVSGPTEAERQARAEHLKRQREALVAKKKREREAELSNFQQTSGPTAAARAAERACARSGPVGLQPSSPSNEAGKRLAAELSGAALQQPTPALPDPEAAAVQMRKTIARQLKQSLTQATVG